MSEAQNLSDALLEIVRPMVSELVQQALADRQAPADRPGQLIGSAEVAARLSVSERHVQRMCITGQLPAVRVGNRWRVSVDDLPAPRASNG